MKKTMKKVISLILVVAVLSSSFVCFAAELNKDAVSLHKGQYKNYVLLGDSVASGYRDVMSDNDDAYNKAYGETAYHRVPGSYADVLVERLKVIAGADVAGVAGWRLGFETEEIWPVIDAYMN